MSGSLAVIAGTISTGIFAASTMPMVVKAARTRDLSSDSGGNLVLSNLGNVLYVFSMPMGPAWALYAFNLAVSATVLGYWLRYRTPHGSSRAPIETQAEVEHHAGRRYPLVLVSAGDLG